MTTTTITQPGRPPAGTRRIDVVVVTLLAIGAVLVAAIRAMPNMGTPDRGVFVDVAERLDAGDRLYVGVWDNKDPVFFYLMAVGRLVTPLADYALELGWLAVVTVATYGLARRVVPGRLPAVAASALGLLAVTGTTYVAGYTYLPGTALSLVAIALVASDRYGWAGAAVGVLAFTKPLMGPLVLAAIVVWWLRRHRWDDVRRFAVGFIPVVLGFVALLAVRGELGGWVGAQFDNVDYAQSRVAGSVNPVLDHLTRVFGAREVLILVVAVAVALGTLWWARRQPEMPVDVRNLAIAIVAVTVAAFVVTAVTGMATLNNQILQLPVALTCALLARPLGSLLGRPTTAVACLVIVPVAAWLVGGVTAASEYRDALTFFRGSAGVLLQTPPDAQAILALGPTGSYARLGGEYDDGHAKGLRDWQLVCPRTHQYFFQPAAILGPALECVATAPVVLVSPTFAPRPESLDVPDWNEFVREGEAMLARDFICTPHEDFRICVRKEA